VAFEEAFCVIQMQRYCGTETQSVDCRLEVCVVLVASSVQGAAEVDKSNMSHSLDGVHVWVGGSSMDGPLGRTEEFVLKGPLQ
jgi:hypothetical protein